MLEHKWRASLKTRLFLLTSNTEATENKVQFLNLAYRVKGFQCHSNNSLQLLELKEKKTTTKQYTLFKSFLCDILILVVVTHNALTQLDMHLHRLTFAVV